MKITVPREQFKSALNNDPEFRLAARYWSGSLQLCLGEDVYAIRLRGGEVEDVGAMGGAPAGSGHVVISAPVEDWAKLLEAVPKPFYQEFYSASMHHGFRLLGDPDYLWPYYSAIRRSGELLRTLAVVSKE